MTCNWTTSIAVLYALLHARVEVAAAPAADSSGGAGSSSSHAAGLSGGASGSSGVAASSGAAASSSGPTPPQPPRALPPPAKPPLAPPPPLQLPLQLLPGPSQASAPILLINYDKPASIEHKPQLSILHGFANRIAVDGARPYAVADLTGQEFSFLSGGRDSWEGVLAQSGEGPLALHARRVFIEHAEVVRKKDSAMRGENFITKSVVMSAATSTPSHLGYELYFTVEDCAEGENSSRTVATQERIDVSIWAIRASDKVAPLPGAAPGSPLPGSPLPLPECVLDCEYPMVWNDFMQHICGKSKGKAWYNRSSDREVLDFWNTHLKLGGPGGGSSKRARGADSTTARPSRWLQSSTAAIAMGAHRVLVVEAKWLAKWNVDEVKCQAVSYACSLTHS